MVMRFKRSLVIAFLGAFSLTGCLSTTVHFKSGVAGTPNYEERQNFYLWGFYPDAREHKESELCGDNDSLMKARTVTTATDLLFTVVTLGIYAPKTLVAWCGR